MVSLTIGRGGEVALPQNVRERYGMKPNTPVRVIETRSGVLLVPLTDAPMSEELARELEQWQAHSMEAWKMFPYEDADAYLNECEEVAALWEGSLDSAADLRRLREAE